MSISDWIVMGAMVVIVASHTIRARQASNKELNAFDEGLQVERERIIELLEAHECGCSNGRCRKCASKSHSIALIKGEQK